MNLWPGVDGAAVANGVDGADGSVGAASSLLLVVGRGRKELLWGCSRSGEEAGRRWLASVEVVVAEETEGEEQTAEGKASGGEAGR